MRKEGLSMYTRSLAVYLLLILDKLNYIDNELTTKIKNKKLLN